MVRRRRRKREQSEVELNLAAMLDMAFQLLTFFILTFRPAPIEGQISLRLPPAHAVLTAQSTLQAGQNADNTNPVQGLSTLTISIFSNPQSGMIEGVGVGESQFPGLAALRNKLAEVFSDEANPFDQVLIQVSDTCRYDELMKVIDICTQQEIMIDGKRHKLSKLSFVELPSGS